jgi:type IX secretion system PorP/SprF family membrane protein
MMTKSLKLICLLIIIPSVIFGQELFNTPDYQSTMISNPGITGGEGDGLIRFSYMNRYPGNNFNVHSAFISYDAYFPSLHGGAGFYLSDNYLGGIVNDLKGGLSYSYFFRAGENLFFSAGLSASFLHRGYNFSGAILPDQIDPLMGVIYPSGEVLSPAGSTVFDIGTGFLIITGRVFGGIAISHLSKPDIYKSDFGDASLRRSLLLHIAGEVGINRDKNLLLRPLGKLEVQKGLLTAGTGAVLEANHLAFNTIFFFNSHRNIDVQTGFSISFAGIVLNYNYHFNVASGENLLPVSILHQAGIAVSLNDVDKRKTIKTINFPKL